MRDAFLDLVLGAACLGCRRPGRAVCAVCAAALPSGPEEALPARPDPSPDGLAPAFAAVEYAGLGRALVVRHKEERAFGLVATLARLLAVPLAAVLEGCPEQALAVLVPVPSRAAAVRARGHDPVARMVRRAASGLPGVRAAGLLRAGRPTRDQSDLDAASRAQNLAGAFVVSGAAVRRVVRTAAGRRVVAIVRDDVITTGSTLREAQRALEAAGVPVAAVVAVAATRRRFPRQPGAAVGPGFGGPLPL